MTHIDMPDLPKGGHSAKKIYEGNGFYISKGQGGSYNEHDMPVYCIGINKFNFNVNGGNSLKMDVERIMENKISIYYVMAKYLKEKTLENFIEEIEIIAYDHGVNDARKQIQQAIFGKVY